MKRSTAIVAVFAILAMYFLATNTTTVYVPVYKDVHPAPGVQPDYTIPKWLLFGGLGYAIGRNH
mgnify:CR=1 FL=1